MGIYVSPDNKILLSNSGEILKQPPIIDISSDYGVTKDGSNLVSKVKNRYNSNVFRAPSGNEPIENGDGFEFGNGKELRGVKFNYLQSYILEAWIYATSYAVYNVLFSSYDNSNNSDGIWLQIYSLYNALAFRANGVNIASSNAIINQAVSPLGEWSHLLLSQNLKEGVNASSYSTYVNGKPSVSQRFTTPTTQSRVNAVIGGMINQTHYFRGNVKTFKITPKYVEFFRNHTTSTSVKYYDGSIQVFTPPTYPNTLL